MCLPLKTEEELQTILSEGSTPRREWRACRNCGRQIYSYHSICGECRRQRRPDEGGEPLPMTFSNKKGGGLEPKSAHPPNGTKLKTEILYALLQAAKLDRRLERRQKLDI